jgi:oligopeptide transport system ATP-binding protein
MSAALLQARDVAKRYAVPGAGKRVVHALSGVSLEIFANETLAVVGESGCGKTTLARCLIGLIEPSDGEIFVGADKSRDLLKRDPQRFHRYVQIVFQDPYASLNPRRTIYQSVSDGLRLHRLCARAERRGRVAALLQKVGLGPDYLDRYPHELSGGQRQRAAIARALAVQPAIVICDEPVSALDVSVQAQVINLLKDLQRELGVAYLFISHNLALVRRISDRIAVMYLGQIVEIGSVAEFRAKLFHPYTQALFAAAPIIGREPRGESRAHLGGEVPSPIDPPSGCRFHTRCPHKRDRCAAEMPDLREVAGRFVRCHFAEDVAAAPPA